MSITTTIVSVRKVEEDRWQIYLTNFNDTDRKEFSKTTLYNGFTSKEKVVVCAARFAEAAHLPFIETPHEVISVVNTEGSFAACQLNLKTYEVAVWPSVDSVERAVSEAYFFSDYKKLPYVACDFYERCIDRDLELYDSCDPSKL